MTSIVKSEECRVQSAEVISAKQGKLIDDVRTMHANVQRAFGDQIGFAFLAGLKLQALKESCEHGQFEDLRKAHLQELPERTARRYQEFFNLVKDKTATVADFRPAGLAMGNGDLPNGLREKVLAAVYKLADGKTWVAFHRDLKLIRDAEKPGGYKVNAKKLAAWLEKKHPEHAGKSYDELPKKLQKAFRKEHPPKRATAEDLAFLACNKCEGLSDLIHEVLKEKAYAHMETQRRRILADLARDLADVVRKTLKGNAKGRVQSAESGKEAE